MKSEFGKVLREVMRSQCGSAKGFAMRMGVTPGFVSQISMDSGRNPATLERILDVVDDYAERKRLHEAWIATYAPVPTVAETPGEDASDDEILAFADLYDLFIRTGAGWAGFNAYSELWGRLRASSARPMVRVEVGKAFCHLALSVDRRGPAIAVASEVTRIGKESREPRGYATGLALQGMALRTGGIEAATMADKALGRLAEYLAYWPPTAVNDRRFHERKTRDVTRDAVLAAWDVASRRPSDDANGLLSKRVETMRRSLGDSDRTLAREVEARAFAILGDIDGAWESLSRSETILPSDPQMQVKRGITKARILLAEGDLSEAEAQVNQMAAKSVELGLVHYQHTISGLEMDVYRQASRKQVSVFNFGAGP